MCWPERGSLAHPEEKIELSYIAVSDPYQTHYSSYIEEETGVVAAAAAQRGLPTAPLYACKNVLLAGIYAAWVALDVVKLIRCPPTCRRPYSP